MEFLKELLVICVPINKVLSIDGYIACNLYISSVTYKKCRHEFDVFQSWKPRVAREMIVVYFFCGLILGRNWTLKLQGMASQSSKFQNVYGEHTPAPQEP